MHRLPIGLALLLSLGACAAPPPPAPEPIPVTPPSESAPPRRAQVEDLAAFERFIATQPTPADFRTRYAGVALVLPGQIATKEFRTDRSRYFAELNAAGRITGGRFQ